MMTMGDIVLLSEHLHALYGDRFPLLLPAQARLWFDDLRSADPEQVDEAVTRWARQHHTTYAPTLHNLIDTLDLVEEDSRIQRARLRPESAPVSIGTILADAAAHQATPGTKAWAHEHVQLLLNGYATPGNYHLAAEQCRVNAARYPDERREWLLEAQWWEQGAHGPCTLARQPGEEG